MVPLNLSKRGVNPIQLAIVSGMSTNKRACRCNGGGCACAIPQIWRPSVGLRGMHGYRPTHRTLGFVPIGSATDIFNAGQTATGQIGSVLDSVQMGLSFVPGVGQMAGSTMAIFRQAISQFETWLGIGKGRVEADIIVPVQNDLMSQLGAITNQILIGQNPDVYRLQTLYLEVWQLALGFIEFVLNPEFIDRRASGQALNTIMPYIDGTCGYPEPLGQSVNPGSRNCLTWGDGTVGGAGSDGMLGALGRGIENQGGAVPDLGVIQQQAEQGVDPETIELPYQMPPFISSLGGSMPLILGVASIFLLSRMKKRG